ncbi:MAG: hypothetical protein ACYC8T_10180 [Myxococcaceae bacterium]
MGWRALLLCLWVALAGCRTVAPQVAPRGPVEVTAIAASFTGADRGELGLTLEVENREAIAVVVSRVTWELWLGGRWFAAGTQGVGTELSAGERRVIELTMPLAFRRLEVRAEPANLDAAVRGGVDLSFGGLSNRLPFESTRRIVAQGAPVLTAGGEGD